MVGLPSSFLRFFLHTGRAGAETHRNGKYMECADDGGTNRERFPQGEEETQSWGVKTTCDSGLAHVALCGNHRMGSWPGRVPLPLHNHSSPFSMIPWVVGD